MENTNKSLLDMILTDDDDCDYYYYYNDSNDDDKLLVLHTKLGEKKNRITSQTWINTSLPSCASRAEDTSYNKKMVYRRLVL